MNKSAVKSGSERQKKKLKKGKIKILVIEEHAIFREGLILFLNKEADMFVCCEVHDARDTMEKIKCCMPDMVLIDISNIGIPGIDLIKSIKDQYPLIRILVISMYEGSYLTRELKRAGASGCVIDQLAPELLINKIRELIV